MIKLKLKDGSIMEVEKGTKILDVAKEISEGLARAATCGEINGEVKDLRYEINEDCELVIHTFQDEDLEGKKHIGIQVRILWHKLLKDYIKM